MSRRTGPTVRGTKKDGSPRTYAGQLPRIECTRPADYFILVDDPNSHVINRRGLFSPPSELDHRLDAYDAANEDRWGRLPHQKGYGRPPLKVIDGAGAPVVPLPVKGDVDDLVA